MVDLNMFNMLENLLRDSVSIFNIFFQLDKNKYISDGMKPQPDVSVYWFALESTCGIIFQAAF